MEYIGVFTRSPDKCRPADFLSLPLRKAFPLGSTHLEGLEPINALVSHLVLMEDRWVIDETGLPAHYDVNLRYMPDGVHQRRPDGVEVPDCFDIFAALPRQLGLRLEAAKGPVEFLVVEHVEKPTEN